jgi:hypothetical protein
VRGAKAPLNFNMKFIKTIKFTLDAFVYVLFAVAVIGMVHSIYTNDFMSMIPSGFGIFVFGSCICVSRFMQRRIQEIENGM